MGLLDVLLLCLGVFGYMFKHGIVDRFGWYLWGGMEYWDEWIVVETDCYWIIGVLCLLRDGYRSCLIDYLNLFECVFVVLMDVELVLFDGGDT